MLTWGSDVLRLPALDRAVERSVQRRRRQWRGPAVLSLVVRPAPAGLSRYRLVKGGEQVADWIDVPPAR